MAQVISVPTVNLTTSAVTQRYYAFILDPNSLVPSIALNSSVDGGATWPWTRLPGGPSAGFLTFAAATAFFSGNLAKSGATINQFYVFAVGNDGNMWVNISLDDGANWGWQNNGAPGGTGFAGGPDAVSRQSVESATFEQDVFCHIIGSDGNLYVNFSMDNGKTFTWANRGAPSGTKLAPGQPSVLAYFDGTHQRIYAFAVGDDNNLYANSGDGSSWGWQIVGKPPTTGVTMVPNFRPTSLTIPPDAAKEIYVFVIGEDGNQYAVYSPSDGTGWMWKPLGAPPGKVPIQTFLPNALRAETESEVKSTVVFKYPVYTFVVGNDFNLYIDFSPDASLGLSSTWSWQPEGNPGTGLTSLNGAVSSSEVESSVADEQFYVFVTDIDNDVHTLRWNGSSWTWHDQLGPP